jgi:hypothetical protein
VKVAADELGRQGVRINAVRPGLTRTGATDGMFGARPLIEAFLAEQPIRHEGEPADIARAIRFLAGPESAWITGEALTVDGGHTIRKFPCARRGREGRRRRAGPRGGNARGIERRRRGEDPASPRPSASFDLREIRAPRAGA